MSLPAPNATTAEEVKEILDSFYTVYYPAKLNSIEIILEKYVDNYDKLLLQLRDKYAKEFSPIYEKHLEKKRLEVADTMDATQTKVSENSQISRVDDLDQRVKEQNEHFTNARHRRLHPF